MKTIDFVKMAGSGNDFVVIDNTGRELPVTGRQLVKFVKEICRRKVSVGADGVLLLEKSKSGDVKMRVFNPDGGEVEMCGNGARCAALLAGSKGRRAKNRINIETRAGIIGAEITAKGRVRIKMTPPKDIRLNLILELADAKLEAHYINTGVPHVVCFSNDLEKVDVVKIGRGMRYHPEFRPRGTNVDFVEVTGPGAIRIRTYERGVEEETLACGTGAVAGALIAARLGLIKQKGVKVKTREGEILKVYFETKGDRFDNVWLEGEAKIVYKGRYVYV